MDANKGLEASNDGLGLFYQFYPTYLWNVTKFGSLWVSGGFKWVIKYFFAMINIIFGIYLFIMFEISIMQIN